MNAECSSNINQHRIYYHDVSNFINITQVHAKENQRLAIAGLFLLLVSCLTRVLANVNPSTEEDVIPPKIISQQSIHVNADVKVKPQLKCNVKLNVLKL